jgi:hypothetical protein
VGPNRSTEIRPLLIPWDLGSHTGGYEEFYLLVYNFLYSAESKPTFRSYIFAFSGQVLATCFHSEFLLHSFFDSKDGGETFLRNVGRLSMDYTALYRSR